MQTPRWPEGRRGDNGNQCKEKEKEKIMEKKKTAKGSKGGQTRRDDNKNECEL